MYSHKLKNLTNYISHASVLVSQFDRKTHYPNEMPSSMNYTQVEHTFSNAETAQR